MEQKQYFAFISYKREDEKWASWLQHKLEHYKLPSNLNGRTDLPKYIRPVFKDTSELSSGVLADEIKAALNQSQYLIIICSPNASKSKWVNKEAQSFIETGRADRIIPFIIDGTPHSIDPETECFPIAIRQLPETKELLGININEMGRDAAAMKVIAHMLGLKFDTLWHRYEKAKRKRFLYWAIAIVGFALVSIGVALYIFNRNKQLEIVKNNLEVANTQLTEANKQIIDERDRANQEKENANQERNRANLERDRANLERNRSESLVSSLKVANDSILIQQTQLFNTNQELVSSNWSLMERQARYVSERASRLIYDDSILSALVLYSVIPTDVVKPERPYIPEIEAVLRKALSHRNTILKGHSDTVYSACFSPNGQYIVSTSADCSIRIWDVSTGLCIKTLKGHTGAVYYAEMNPDGTLVVSVSDDGTTRIWDFESGKCLHVFHYTGILNQAREIIPFSRACFSPNGELIAIPNYADMEVIIWSIELGQTIGNLKVDTPYYSLCFSPDGCELAITGYMHTITIWNLDSFKCERTIRFDDFLSDDFLYSSRFSNDGEMLVSSTIGGSIVIWSARTGEMIKTIAGHNQPVFDSCFSSDRSIIASGSYDTTIKLWDVNSGKCIR